MIDELKNTFARIYFQIPKINFLFSFRRMQLNYLETNGPKMEITLFIYSQTIRK